MMARAYSVKIGVIFGERSARLVCRCDVLSTGRQAETVNVLALCRWHVAPVVSGHAVLEYELATAYEYASYWLSTSCRSFSMSLQGRHWTVDLTIWLILSHALFIHCPQPAAALSRKKWTSLQHRQTHTIVTARCSAHIANAMARCLWLYFCWTTNVKSLK